MSAALFEYSITKLVNILEMTEAQALPEDIVAFGDLTEEIKGLKSQKKKKEKSQTGSGTHKENVLSKNNLEDTGHSLKELAEISQIPLKILQEVYNRGIGAYKTNPTSVRMKGTYKKGVNAPMIKKLSKEQWAMARVYSFLDGNPKHDQDLTGGIRRPGERLEHYIHRLRQLRDEVIRMVGIEGWAGSRQEQQLQEAEAELEYAKINDHPFRGGTI